MINRTVYFLILRDSIDLFRFPVIRLFLKYPGFSDLESDKYCMNRLPVPGIK